MEALPPSPPPSPPPSTEPYHSQYSYNQPSYNPNQAPFQPAHSTQYSLGTTPSHLYPAGPPQVHYIQSQPWAGQGYASGYPPPGPAHWGPASSPPTQVPYYPRWGPGCPERYPPCEQLNAQAYHQPLFQSPPYHWQAHTAGPAYTPAGSALQSQPHYTQQPPSLQPISLAHGPPTTEEYVAFANRLQVNFERHVGECAERFALHEKYLNFLVHSVREMATSLEDVKASVADLGCQRKIVEHEAESLPVGDLRRVRTDIKKLNSQVDSLREAHSVDEQRLHDFDNELALVKVGLRRRYPDCPF